ncbi:hypothetical protein XENOCAPTIV_013823 [Xenoophorus captivus]|uniref:Uncharacterized protein n=1 Tax=Xenoophorus captivus TaxID=1517983 RepID=A0ABV0QEF9_9TELE
MQLKQLCTYWPFSSTVCIPVYKHCNLVTAFINAAQNAFINTVGSLVFKHYSDVKLLFVNPSDLVKTSICRVTNTIICLPAMWSPTETQNSPVGGSNVGRPFKMT